MKEIREELKKLGDTVATSLGVIVIGIAVVLVLAIVMRAIYCKPPEEHRERCSHSWSRGRGNMMNLIANPANNWHPLNVYRR